MSQKYAAYNAQGAITGFYDDVDSPVPKSVTAIEITDAQWQTCLATPGYTVSGGSLVVPSSAYLLAQAQTAQIGALTQAYDSAIAQPVSYASKAGVAKTYQADPDSVGKLQNMLAACSGAQTTPAGFYWLSADNVRVPFEYADLQGLAAAMGAQGFAAFAHLQTLKAEVRAASDSAAVAAIVW